MKKLTAQQIEDQLTEHIPHRLCLLVTFRDRQDWFRKQVGSKENDLLRVSKDSALISIRLFCHFLGFKLNGSKTSLVDSELRGDDAGVEMLGGEKVDANKLPKSEKDLLAGLLTRADKELAHLTSNYERHAEFNTASALIEGITLVERLLRQQLYERLNRPFPNLDKERNLSFDEWNFPDGQKSPTAFVIKNGASR